MFSFSKMPGFVNTRPPEVATVSRAYFPAHAAVGPSVTELRSTGAEPVSLYVLTVLEATHLVVVPCSQVSERSCAWARPGTANVAVASSAATRGRVGIR